MSTLPRAHELGLAGCRVCGLVCRDVPRRDAACPRCGSSLHQGETHSVARSWALLIAAFILYIPANVLPIMRTASLGEADDNTILGGVAELWRNGSQGVAFIVFTASIVVPTTKFLVLGTLLVSSQRGSSWARSQRALLFRVVEFIGYWSMLDVFVVALLAALVQFGVFGLVEPLRGVMYFALTVVLTMLASMSFDPRLIWDARQSDG
jgi:paraquat-inducible protein A